MQLLSHYHNARHTATIASYKFDKNTESLSISYSSSENRRLGNEY